MRDAAINLRALPEQRDLIDHAANLLCKNRSDFMLETACDRAQAVVLDQVFFSLDTDKFKQFTAMLDAPTSPPGAPARGELATQRPRTAHRHPPSGRIRVLGSESRRMAQAPRIGPAHRCHWQDAVNRAVIVSHNAGVRALLIHALDDRAKRFYEHYGFQESPQHPMTLMLSLNTMKA